MILKPLSTDDKEHKEGVLGGPREVRLVLMLDRNKTKAEHTNMESLGRGC